MNESQEIELLFQSLLQQPKRPFPAKRQSIQAPLNHGVYIIYCREDVLHVGRTIRGKNGLQQRLKNHLRGISSFTRNFLLGEGNKLRDGDHTFKYLEVEDPRKRALLESLAIGKLCPRHIGIGVTG